MKLKRNTWLLLVLATILGGWVYFYEIRGKAKRNQIEVQQQQIFNFTEQAIAKPGSRFRPLQRRVGVHGK